MNYLNLVVELLVGIAVLLVGLKLLDDFLKRLPKKGITRVLGKFSDNPVKGAATGAACTAVTQNSSVTAVMTVGFAKAGILPPARAAGVVFGANVGMAISGFITAATAAAYYASDTDARLSFVLYASIIAVVGVIIHTWARRERVKDASWFIVVIGLIITGASIAGASAENLSDADMHSVLNAVPPAILLIIGIIAAALLQSSRAITLLITLSVLRGDANVSGGMFLILGANLGACVTPLIAALGADTNAKRTAVLNLSFNAAATVLFAAAMLPMPSETLNGIFAPLSASPAFQLAWFTLARSIISAVIFLPLAKYFLRLSELIIREKDVSAAGGKRSLFKFIDPEENYTPANALKQAACEIVYMYGETERNFNLAAECFLKHSGEQLSAFSKSQKLIDDAGAELMAYLAKLPPAGVSTDEEILIGEYYRTICNIQKIGNRAVAITERTQKALQENIVPQADDLRSVNDFYAKIKVQFKDALESFIRGDSAKLKNALRRKAEIENDAAVIAREHARRTVGELKSSPDGGKVFYGIIADLESAAERLADIAQSAQHAAA